MTRQLPGAYSLLRDSSALPEGPANLAVGIQIKANKGPVGEVTLITGPQDLLTTYTFKNTVGTKDDYSFHTALSILKRTNQLYVNRVAKNALYGGAVVKKEDSLGSLIQVGSSAKKFYIEGNVVASISSGDTLRVGGVSENLDGKYTVASVTFNTPNTEIVVTEDVLEDYSYSTGEYPKAFKSRQPVPLNQEEIGAITGVSTGSSTFILSGDLTDFFPVGDKIEVKGSTGNNGIYTVVSSVYGSSNTSVEVSETVPNATTDGTIYRNSIVNPENYTFKPEDLFLVTGTDEGLYNSLLELKLVSSNDNADQLTESDVCELSVYDSTTNGQLVLPTMFSRDPEAKAVDGTPLYIESVFEDNAYIKVVDNTDVDTSELPCSTVSNVQTSGGSDGDEVNDVDMVAGLNLYADKTIPISLMANGSIESSTYQDALIALAEERKDFFNFLNSRLVDEKATTNSAKASNIVKYKKETLASNSFYSAMYAPHVVISDVFNSRKIKVGADAKVIPGWLGVIQDQGFPYAHAGYRFGKMEGAKCDWKIGEASGEAKVLNDASVNFIAFDPVLGVYVVWNQNTLQVANSALRNVGTVLNVLDIKQTLYHYLKQYLQLPITDDLRGEIKDNVSNYMDGVKSRGRVSDYAFQDTSTSEDISNDTLRFVLSLSPAYYAQKIYLVINLVNQTFDFQILQKL
jgi:hypothetical protein